MLDAILGPLTGRDVTIALCAFIVGALLVLVVWARESAREDVL